MDSEVAKIKWNGLQCDYCDFKDEAIPRIEFEGYINKPCPLCGENLLSENDYLNVLILENAVNETNKYKFGLDLSNSNDETVTYEVNLHNSITIINKSSEMFGSGTTLSNIEQEALNQTIKEVAIKKPTLKNRK